MHKAWIIAACAAALLAGSCDDSKKQTAAEEGGCPSQEDVRTALQNYIEKDYWTPGQRDIWKITGVDGFTYSEIEIGDTIRKVVDYSGTEKEVCPVRVTYSFKEHHADGRVTTKEMGAGKVHLFYPDAFHTWTFKTD